MFQFESGLESTFRTLLKEIPHFPIKGIVFKDISPLLARRGFLNAAVSAIEPVVTSLRVDAVLAVDARGFIQASSWSESLENCPATYRVLNIRASIAPEGWKSRRASSKPECDV
jgi:adenine/guanine phosphoribosyltransferase-like PRPP-binding protein